MANTCRVCGGAIPPAEYNVYDVHDDCMPAYVAQFYAELRRCRRKRRYAGTRLD